MLCHAPDGWDWAGERCEKEVQEGRHVCVHRADSLHCIAEANTTL